MSNLFTNFKNLTTTTSTTVVTIDTVNNDGTSVATTLGGTTITVNGVSVTAGKKAFVRGGEIIREAPNLTIGNYDV